MIRHALQGLLNAVILLFLLFVGAVILVQTGPGKRFLAAQLSTLLSTPEAGIEIAGIHGWIPVDMRLERVRLSDPGGFWLAASDVVVDWSPSALLGGRIRIETIRIGHLHVARLPTTSEAAEPETTAPFQLPALPESIPPITIANLGIPKIDLDAAVLGEAASFVLDGSLTAADDGRHVDLTLDLQRTDQNTAFATLTSTVSLAPAMLAIDLDAGETGDLLAKLTDRPNAGNLDLSLSGKGPLDAWSGKLNVQADGLGTADADLSLALIDQPRIELEAVFRPAPLVLPETISDLIGDSLDVTLGITQTRAQALTIERIDLGADQFGITARGTVDFDQGDLALKAAVDAPDLNALSDLAGITLAGQAGLTMDVGGTLEEPSGRFDLRINELAADGITAADITTGVDWKASAPLDPDLAVISISATGSATGLSVPDTPLPDPNVAWQAALELPLDGAITVQEVSVTTAETTLTAKGTIDPRTLISALDIQLLAPALSRLVAPYGQQLEGRALINAAVNTTNGAENVTVNLKAMADRLAALPAGAGELLGDKVELETVISLDRQRYLSVGDLSLRGAGAALSGSADLDLETQALGADIIATLPRLAALAPLIKQEMEGAIDLKARVGGTVDAPLADLEVASQGLMVAGEPIETLSLSLSGRKLTASPEGKLQLDLTARTMPITLALDYRLDGNTLRLSEVNLDGPEMALAGALAIDLDRTIIDGALQGGVNDLAALESLLEQKLEGALSLDVRLLADQPRQNANLSLKGKNIKGDFGQIDGIDLTASIQDLLGKMTLSAQTTVKKFEQGKVTLSSLTLETQGDLERLAFDFDVDGKAIEPLIIKADGTLTLSDGSTLHIERLHGAFAGDELALNQPVTIEQSDQILRLVNLDLHLGAASLKGDIDIGPDDVRGKLDLKSLPLNWLERFNGPAINGTANAVLDLGGTARRPRINAALDLNDIQSENLPEASDLAPIDVAVRTAFKNGHLTSSLLASGLTEQPITARIAHPMTLKLSPFALDLPEDGAIDGEISVKILLARLGDVLALDEQVLKGDLSADLKLGGTLAAPVVDGPVDLRNGAYENSFTGTVLRDVTLEANASNTRITVDQLSGRVGKSGTAEASGWINLDPGSNFPLSISLRLSEAQLVSRDDVEATISGDIAMLGDLSHAMIEGDLIVKRAEISIPDGGGPDLPDIEIEEIGGNIINSAKPEETSEPAFDPELDVTIDLPNKIFVRGRGLESEWEGNLAISGATSAPIITGDLRVRNGVFDFIDKRFDLRQGVVSFSGASPPNPILELEAAATDNDFTAIIKLDGPATVPKLRLESEPVLPEDEVLARLLFNRELSEIGAVEAGKLALALNRLRGGGGFDAFGEIRDALKIDTLDIVGGEEAADSKVKAGKYLSDDIYVEVERGAAGESGRARVEVEIFPNVSLEADTGEDSSGGVGLKWHFDY